MLRKGYVYIVSNKYRTVLYTGVTSNLVRRADQHHSGNGSVFSARYNCKDLIYYEEYLDIRIAIAREKQLKNWKRTWKLELIKAVNPDLRTLESW